MTTRKTKYLPWVMALALILACAPGAATPVMPTIDPNLISLYIAQTANAASTQTAAALPTQTPTATFTSTPRASDTPEPTATSTVIFIFFSPTAVPPTFSPSNATGDQNYACQIQSVTPANGTSFNSRDDFDARWRVMNIGKKNWDKDSVDYAYLRGDKFHKVETYDLPKEIKVGQTVDLIVDMVAPKNSGVYTTNWTIRVGAQTFCTLALTIVVK